MNILFIDVETTGTMAGQHTIIELAARLDVNGVTVDFFHKKLFNPSFDINLGALKVNKCKISSLMTNEQEGPVVVAFIDWLLDLQSKVTGDIHIAGQNPSFDINFLKAMLKTYKIDNIEALIGYKTIDTFSLAVALVQAGKLTTENNKLNLEAIAKGLGIDISNKTLHTATDDMNLAAEVYYKIIELLKG